MDNRTLEINLNEEYKIKIESGNDFHNSIFKDVYINALNCVIEIIKQSDKDENNDYDDFNNIIAFTGERGKGKSSSMISFRDALVNQNYDVLRHYYSNDEFEYIKRKSFAKIDIIDPSLFRGEESLFEIILAKMFQKFQKELKENSSKITQDDKRELIQHFQNVFENLQIINSDRKEVYKKESIEALSKLATSSNLRVCFRELVTCYLKKFENGKSCLIIAIDDFDLNISGAYDMLEDIRQFLIQSNIILLIACKMEQLRQIVLSNYFKDYEILFRYKSTEISESDLINKTEKYLEKLFPISRRLELPNLKLF